MTAVFDLRIRWRMNTAPHNRDRRRALAPARVGMVPVEARLASDPADNGPDRLRWVRLLGRAPFQYGKQVWNLDAKVTNPRALQWRWEDVSATLRAQPARFAPTVTTEHARNGMGLGTAVRIVQLTSEQAAAVGIKQPESHALYAGLRLTDPAARDAYDRGALQWVSPAVLAAQPTDEPGHVAPIWIDEISFVTVPHLRGQPNVADMRSVQLSAGARMNAHEKIVQALADKCAELGIDPEQAKKLVDAMAEHMGEEEALEYEDMREAEAEEAEAEEAEAELAGAYCEAPEGSKALAKMAAKVAALEAKLAAQTAASRVDVDTAGKTVGAEAKAALSAMLAAGNEAGYKALLSALPAKSALRANLSTARPAATGPAAPKPAIVMGADFHALDEAGQDAAIEALCAAKGCDYVTAANWCSTGIVPGRFVTLAASGLTPVNGN